MSDIQVFHPTGGIVQHGTAGGKQSQIDLIWWRLFDVPGAVKQLDAHLADKGSDGTPEKHTRKVYESSLRRFLNWAGPRMDEAELSSWTVYDFAEAFPAHRFPLPAVMREYIAYLKRDKKLKKSSVDRNLAPVRLYLKALRRQYVGVVGESRIIVDDCKDFLLQSLEEKTGRTEKKSQSALWVHGTRLEVDDVKAIFNTLSGKRGDGLTEKRDMALMYVGLNTGLREAELRRLTLDGIKNKGSYYEIKVRGKGNKERIIGLDMLGYQFVMEWVEAYNAGLDDDDERRIMPDMPIFQSLRKGGNYGVVGVNGFDPGRGLGKSSVQGIVQKRSAEALGYPINPHDMRRTLAAIGYHEGYDFEKLRIILGHESIETTRGYVGNPVDVEDTIISNVVKWKVQGVA